MGIVAVIIIVLSSFTWWEVSLDCLNSVPPKGVDTQTETQTQVRTESDSESKEDDADKVNHDRCQRYNSMMMPQGCAQQGRTWYL